ncbi:hypothetical protein B0H34DRAFT_862713 [Crassisporium funariophilum]|nr:hypothetical protein B0H34DRAFT_862713 [Crassisporium funariophilum]
MIAIVPMRDGVASNQPTIREGEKMTRKKERKEERRRRKGGHAGNDQQKSGVEEVTSREDTSGSDQDIDMDVGREKEKHLNNITEVLREGIQETIDPDPNERQGRLKYTKYSDPKNKKRRRLSLLDIPLTLPHTQPYQKHQLKTEPARKRKAHDQTSPLPAILTVSPTTLQTSPHALPTTPPSVPAPAPAPPSLLLTISALPPPAPPPIFPTANPAADPTPKPPPELRAKDSRNRRLRTLKRNDK